MDKSYLNYEVVLMDYDPETGDACYCGEGFIGSKEDCEKNIEFVKSNGFPASFVQYRGV